MLESHLVIVDTDRFVFVVLYLRAMIVYGGVDVSKAANWVRSGFS